MACIQQHDCRGNEFIVSQILALVFRVDHVAQKVVLRLCPALRDHATHIIGKFLDALSAASSSSWVRLNMYMPT